MNGDDELSPGILPYLIKNLNLFNRDTILFGNLDIIDNNSQVINKTNFIHQNFSFQYLLNICPSVPTNAILYPKDIFDKIGFFKTNLQFAFDYDFILRASKNYIFEHINKPIIRFRHHKNAKTSKNFLQFDKEIFKIRMQNKGQIVSPASLYSLKRILSYYKKYVFKFY